MAVRRPVKATPQGLSTLDMRTEAGKRYFAVCRVLIETMPAHNGWTLAYTYDLACEMIADAKLAQTSVGEVVFCLNIIRTTFNLTPLHYMMKDGVWMWDYRD
tara:strand:- start:1286 stop:1591 length:306 start_codon:yes stop_codon:yes gene_type:complete